MADLDSSPEPVKTVFVTVVDLSTAGGSGVATKEMIKAFCRTESMEVSLICPEPEGDMPSAIAGKPVDTRFLPPRTSPGALTYHGKEQVALFSELLSCIRDRQPELIVARLAPSLVSPPILASIYRIPYIPLARGWLGTGRSVKKHKLLTLVKLAHRLNFAVGDHTYVPVEGIRSEIRDISSSIPVYIFPNAVDSELFVGQSLETARSGLPYDIAASEFVLGFVGSFARRHRIHDLIRGFSRVQATANARLLLVGDGEGSYSVDNLQEFARDHGVGNDVLFTGPVAHEAVPRFISACDVMFGVSDPDKRSTPIKLFEYLACKRPVITSEQPELSFVSEIECGYVLPEITVEEIAAAIGHYENRDRSSRVEEGRRGREYVKSNHTWDRLPELIIENLGPEPDSR